MSNFIKKYGILICLVFLFLPVNKVGAGLSDYKCCPALKQVKTDDNWETTKEIIGCKYSADNKCVYKANDELCTGRTIYSSAGGIGPRTTKGCDGPSFYVTWDSTPVACFENSLCLSQVPSYKPDAINWSLPNGLHSVTIGEKVDVFVEVEAPADTLKLKEVYLSKDMTEKGVKIINTAQIIADKKYRLTVQVDTLTYKRWLGELGYPLEAPVRFYGLADVLENGKTVEKVSDYSFVLKIIAPDCRNTYTNQSDCKSKNPRFCFWNIKTCESRYDNSICGDVGQPLCGTYEDNVSTGGGGTSNKTCVYNDVLKECISLFVSQATTNYGKPKGYVGPLPACAFTGTCNDINQLLSFFIGVFGSMSLGVIGVFAFAVFIYGGITILTSFGNAEKVKKGQQALVAAVVGIIIALSAYMIVYNILDVMNVKDAFKGLPR
ncbi:MAG TPA: hypothetical protein DEB09_04600 [Candidatus Magasanikbacteria bacterium]|nr:hypothetical protein [Candidatus Magasanikbacteria bacterium]